MGALLSMVLRLTLFIASAALQLAMALGNLVLHVLLLVIRLITVAFRRSGSGDGFAGGPPPPAVAPPADLSVRKIQERTKTDEPARTFTPRPMRPRTRRY